MRTLIAVAIIIFSFTSCGSKNSGPGDTPASATEPRTDNSALAKRFLTAVPADATGVVLLDLPSAPWSMGLNYMGVESEMWEKHRAALEAELKVFMDQRIGLDFSKLQTAVGFVTVDNPDKPSAALMAGAMGGTLIGETTDHEGATELLLEKDDKADIIASIKGDIIVVGDRDSVRAAHAALSTSGTAIASPLANRLATEQKGAYLAAAINAAKAQELMGPSPIPKLQDVLFALSGKKLVAVARGPAASLEAIKNLIAVATDQGMSMVRAEKEKATRPGSDTFEGIGAIYGYHMAAYLADEVKPVIDGDTLTIDLEVPYEGAMVTVSMIGILAAVAIPTFMKYIEKSKATEARELTRRMYDGARGYYMDRSVGGAGTPHFPKQAVGPTPPIGSCCQGPDQKCEPAPSLWTHPTWVALQFSVEDPHYYSYEYKATNNKSEKSFTVSAYGDLDCDGVFSTFTMVGEINDQFSDGPTSTPDLYREQELE